jgi:outer membrane immunogenic protein
LLDLDEKAHVQTARLVLSYRPGMQAAAPDGSEAQWTGFHVGAGFGYSMLNHVLDLDAPPVASVEFSGIGGEGLLGTVEAGADMLLGERFVAGIQGGFTLSAKTTADLTAPGLDADYELAAAHSFDVLARAGILTGPDVLWYGLAGWTRTKFEGDLDINGTSVASYDYDLDGLTVGGGVEVMLTDNLSWKTEYRYTDYESVNIIDFGGGGLDALTNQQSVRSVLSFRL